MSKLEQIEPFIPAGGGQTAFTVAIPGFEELPESARFEIYMANPKRGEDYGYRLYPQQDGDGENDWICRIEANGASWSQDARDMYDRVELVYRARFRCLGLRNKVELGDVTLQAVDLFRGASGAHLCALRFRDHTTGIEYYGAGSGSGCS